jgi:hypothetical protein
MCGPAIEMAKRRWVTIIAWIAGGLLVAYAYAFVSATTTDSEDLSGCQAIVSVVTSSHSVPPSISEPTHPAIFCDLGVHFPLLRSYYSLFIYGVLDKRQQDSIVADLQRFRRASRTQKILVRFFAKENWKTWSDPASGRTGGSRGPESPLVRMWID